ncbi:MAG: hypothetical protein KC708_15520, partial [Anaerolineae bacterium]|nr:hypothetical protein [Anaerolineae bacterium]
YLVGWAVWSWWSGVEAGLNYQQSNALECLQLCLCACPMAFVYLFIWIFSDKSKGKRKPKMEE